MGNPPHLMSTDDLKTRLASVSTDKEKLDTLIRLAEAYLDADDRTEAIGHGQEAYGLALAMGDSKSQARTGETLGIALHEAGRYPEALQVACEVQSLFARLDDVEGLAKNATTMGMVYRKIADYPKALKSYFEALECHERAGDKTGIARVQNNIGNVYLDQGDTVNARKYYQQMLAYVEQTGHAYAISIALNNIGETYNKCGQFTDALASLERALAIRREIGQEQKSASVLVNTAEAHLGTANHAAALDCALRACDFAAASGAFADHIDALIMLGRVHMARHDYEQAHAALDHAAEHAREAHVRQKLVEIQALLSDLYQQTGNIAEALACARNRSALQDALHQDALAVASDTMGRLLETTKVQTRIESQLKIAGEMQMRIVPDIAALGTRHEVDLCAHLQPARDVGGDFYDALFLDHDRLYFCVGDVSDKDVGAALLMAVTHTLLRAYARAGSGPGDILSRANCELETNNPKSMFVTVWLGIFSVSTGILEYADAGHCPPLLVADGKVDWMPRTTHPPLGLFPNVAYASRTTVLKPGDALCIYTDGVTEAFDTESQLFTEQRLHAAVHANPHRSAREMVGDLMRTLGQFATGAPQSDDITLFSLVYRGGTITQP